MKKVIKTVIESAESQHDMRYSVLLALTCFDPVQFSACIISSLELESTCFQYGLKRVFLTKQNLTPLDTNAKLFCAPPGL